MTNRFDRAHENPGMGFAAAVAAICIGPIIAFSPAGKNAYNAVKEALRQDVAVREDYVDNSERERMYVKNDAYRGYRGRKWDMSLKNNLKTEKGTFL